MFTPQELAALTAPYANRVVSLEELHELRHTLSRRLRRARLRELGRRDSGSARRRRRRHSARRGRRRSRTSKSKATAGWRDGAIARRVERYVATPVDIADLEIGLQALREEPLVERVNARARCPERSSGRVYLRLAITERPAFELEVSAANDRSPTVGEDRGTLGFTYRGLVGNGDTLNGQFGVTEGVRRQRAVVSTCR